MIGNEIDRQFAFLAFIEGCWLPLLTCFEPFSHWFELSFKLKNTNASVIKLGRYLIFLWKTYVCPGYQAGAGLLWYDILMEALRFPRLLINTLIEVASNFALKLVELLSSLCIIHLRTMSNNSIETKAEMYVFGLLILYLFRWITTSRLVSYACVIAGVSYVYDYREFFSISKLIKDLDVILVLTLEREIELIWKRPITLPTILYIFLRYVTLMAIIISLGKKNIYTWQSYVQFNLGQDLWTIECWRR